MLAKYFGDREFWRDLIRLGLPIALQNLLASSLSLVDTIMIGQLGGDAISAIGMAGQWSTLMNTMCFGFTCGGAVFVAQYWGAKNMDGIRRTHGAMFAFTLAVALAFMAAALLLPRFVVGMFTSDEDVFPMAVKYLAISSLSYPAVALTSSLATTLRSTEHVKLPMFVGIMSVAANVVFNYLFMFVLDMHIAGAAWGSVIAAWLSPICLFGVSWLKRNPIIISPLKKLFDWDRAFMRQFFIILLPSLFNEGLWSVCTVLLNGLYSNLSTDFFAARSMIGSIQGLTWIFFAGMCNASAVLIGKSVGQHDMKKAQDTSRRLICLTPVFGVGIGIITLAFTKPLLSLFNVSDEVYDMMRWVMIIVYSNMWMRGLPYMCIVGTFRPAGDTKTGLKYDLFVMWLICIPLTFILGLCTSLPLPIVYAVTLFSEDLPKTILSLRHYISMKWYRPITDPK